MTEYLGDLFTVRGTTPRSPFIEGIVANSPADKHDQLEVRLRRFDGGRTRFPCDGWTPRDGDLPSRGDKCLVVQSNLGRYWCLVWMTA
jgi:hypothetical protein